MLEVSKPGDAPAGVHAVLLAAGTGSRFGGTKQLELFRGRPVFAWTLEILFTISDNVIVVGELPESLLQTDCHQARQIAGGKTRVDSIRAAIRTCFELPRLREEDVIVFADANRPLNGRSVYERCIELARQFGTACPSVALSDGVGIVSQTADRIVSIPRKSETVGVQTPEAIRVRRLRLVSEQFEQADPPLGIAEATLRLEKDVATFKNNQRGFKVTFPQDLEVLNVIDATADDFVG